LKSLRLLSPAKVNLRLEIIGKREDGYHDIKTICQKISLYDTITLKVLTRRDIVVTADNSAVPADKTNLAYLAADLIIRDQNISTGILIDIQKIIPVGGGLGGGSSNAATTLLGINNLLQLQLSSEYLSRIALKIGADVPFFIADFGTALAAGIGEKIQPMRVYHPMWFLLVYPGFEVSTSWAYKEYDAYIDLTNKMQKNRMNNLAYSMSDIVSALHNDFEPMIAAYHPEIIQIKERLFQAGALGSLLSGSGSSVFGLFPSETAARHALRLLKKNMSHKIFLAQSLG